MIILEIVVAALLLSLLTGGSVAKLKQASLYGENLLLLLLPAQMLWPRFVRLVDVPCSTSVVVWLTMMAVLVVLVAINARRFPMLAVAALGVAANMLVIAVNGSMPVSIRAASEIGGGRQHVRSLLTADCLHQEMGADARLPFLSDTIAIPGPAWHRAVISPGDILLGVGLGGWLFTSTRDRSRA